MQRRAIRESQNQISDILQSIVEHEELQHNINLSHDGKGCSNKNGGGATFQETEVTLKIKTLKF